MKKYLLILLLVSSPALAETAPQPQPAPQTTPAPTPVEDKPVRFAVGVYGSTADKLIFNDAEFISGSTSTKGRIEYDASSAKGITAEVIYARHNKPGFSAGIDYETPRKISVTPSVVTNGAAYTPTTAAETTIQFTSLYGNFLYRWDIFFLYIGANLSAAHLTNAPPLLNGSNGSFGGQLGAGFIFDDHFSVDLGAHAKGIYSDTISDGGLSVRPRAGMVGSWNLALKYIF